MTRFNKMPGYVLLVIAVLFISSCRNTKNSTIKKEDASEIADKESSQNYDLIVSFFSPGNGIDHEMKKAYTTFLSENYPDIDYEKVEWGKEGEIDLCFQLKDLSETQKVKFIEESRDLLSNSSRIRIMEDAPCLHK